MRGRRAKVVVEAERFVLRDARGNRRATFDVERDGPTLRFLDERGSPRFILGVGRHGPACRILDEGANPKLVLSAGAEGAGITIRTQSPDTSVTVALLPDSLLLTYIHRTLGRGGRSTSGLSKGHRHL